MKTIPIVWLFFAVSTVVLAEELDSPPAPAAPSLELNLGGFLLTDIKTDFQITGPRGNATKIDFGDVLGGEQSVNILRADAIWHFKSRHRVDLSWFDIDLHGHRVLDAAITVGDHDYAVGADITSRFRSEVYKLAYGYTFYRNERDEVTALIGAHVVGFLTSVGTADHSQVENFSVTAPLPVFGLEWKAQWNSKLSTRASAEYFGISVDDHKASGHLTDLQALVQYRLQRNWGVGGGYDRFDLQGNFRAGPLTMTLTHHYNGLLVYLFAEF